MKKRFLLLVTALLCLSICSLAFAASPQPVEPCGIITFSSGLPKVSGTTNQYNPWVSAQAALSEKITVGFTLYKVVNGKDVYVTSASKSATASYVEAEDFVTLEAGTYKLYAYYVGTTKSDSSTTTYIIK